MIKTVKAKKVREGDFLVALDHGYVPWAPDIDEYRTEILYHDQDGEECTLSVPNDTELKVSR